MFEFPVWTIFDIVFDSKSDCITMFEYQFPVLFLFYFIRCGDNHNIVIGFM